MSVLSSGGHQGLLRRLRLRSRLALLSAVAVAVGVAVASLVAYIATERALRAQVDRGLLFGPLASVVSGDSTDAFGVPLTGATLELICTSQFDLLTRTQAVVGSVELVRADGSSCTPPGGALVAPVAEDIAAAQGGAATQPRDDVTVAGDPVRVRTQPIIDGYALLVSRDLGEVESALRSLALVLLLASGLGVVLAATAGLLIARSGLRPVDELTRAAERVAETQDLHVPIAVRGDDEVARLGQAFNRMMGALAAAQARQQQLVADASHELRTPLTSLRTNIELLVRSDTAGRPLPADDRSELLASLSGQLEELSQLVSELTMLAREEPVANGADVRLDEVVRRAVGRAGRRGDRVMDVELAPWSVRGDAAALERAVLNLLDNAIKFSATGSTIRVRLTDGVLTVVDTGVGIDQSDADRMFDRFWRAPAARPMPGSGLGLSIVADVVRDHGGQVEAAPGAGGGTRITLTLPGVATR